MSQLFPTRTCHHWAANYTLCRCATLARLWIRESDREMKMEWLLPQIMMKINIWRTWFFSRTQLFPHRTCFCASNWQTDRQTGGHTAIPHGEDNTRRTKAGPLLLPRIVAVFARRYCCQQLFHITNGKTRCMEKYASSYSMTRDSEWNYFIMSSEHVFRGIFGICLKLVLLRIVWDNAVVLMSLNQFKWETTYRWKEFSWKASV